MSKKAGPKHMALRGTGGSAEGSPPLITKAHDTPGMPSITAMLRARCCRCCEERKDDVEMSQGAKVLKTPRSRVWSEEKGIRGDGGGKNVLS